MHRIKGNLVQTVENRATRKSSAENLINPQACFTQPPQARKGSYQQNQECPQAISAKGHALIQRHEIGDEIIDILDGKQGGEILLHCTRLESIHQMCVWLKNGLAQVFLSIHVIDAILCPIRNVI